MAMDTNSVILTGRLGETPNCGTRKAARLSARSGWRLTIGGGKVMSSGWRIWLVAELVAVPDGVRTYALAYELTGLPCVPMEGDVVSVPSWINDSGSVEGDTYTIRSRFFWSNGRYVTLSVEHVEYDHADDMQRVGWIPESQSKMETANGDMPAFPS